MLAFPGGSMSFTRLFLAIGVLTLVASATPQAFAQSADEIDLPNGRFYTQARGSAPAGTGFAVTDADGVPFWTAFRQFGGVQGVGYPVTHRFKMKGFTTQAFQKVVFQHRPDQGGAVVFVNVFDELSAAGKDNWLAVQKEVPKSQAWTEDTGKDWPTVQANHNSLLDKDPAIKAVFQSVSDPIAFNGLPMSYEDKPNIAVLRAQRKVFQRWKTDQPWAKAGQVLVANGGDVGKEAELYPKAATEPTTQDKLPAAIIAEASPTPVPTATANPVPTAAPGVPPNHADLSTGFNSGKPTPNPLHPNCGSLEHKIGESLLKHSDFDGSYNNGVPSNWTWFGSGSVRSIEETGYEKFGRASWRIDGNGAFTGGGYQVVGGLKPGKIYQAFYATAQLVVGNGRRDGALPILREIGMDPTGGTDPNASTVIWGRSSGGQADKDRNAYGGWKTMGQTNTAKWGFNPLVTMIATGDKMTVFVRVKGWPDVESSNTWIESAMMYEACDPDFKF